MIWKYPAACGKLGGWCIRFGLTTSEDSDGGLNWVIVVGESGPKSRPCDIDWIRSIVNQCKVSGVPCFVNQLGSNPVSNKGIVRLKSQGMSVQRSKGNNPDEWPEDLRVRQFPVVDTMIS